MPLPLVALAIGSGLLRTGIGLFQHKHQENVQKNLLGESYGLASKQLQYRQGQVRENLGEGLVERGMSGGGQATNTIAGQERSDTEGQLGLERQDLDLQRRRELAGIKSSFTNNVMGDIEGGVQTGANVFSAFSGGGGGGGGGASAAPAASTGMDSVPSSGVAGAFGIDPLHATPQLSVGGGGVAAPGTPNYGFSVSSAMG